MKNILIKGAREHNLKNISLELPRDKLIVITGLSGSGKSTLAFDTLYAEGQRRYVESLSAYARQFLGLMNKPDVDAIEGLSPAISIEQKTTSKNPRSTVGTVTEVYDYLRLLFARIGVARCPTHGTEIIARSPQNIAQRIMADHQGTVTILAPLIRQKKGTYEKLVEDLHGDGYARVRVNGEIIRTQGAKLGLDRYKKHDIEVVIDRLNATDESRLVEAVESALQQGQGLLLVLDQAGEASLYSANLACSACGFSIEELQPRMFSFNSPFGACDTCSGLGVKMEFEPSLMIPDPSLSIVDGALAVYRKAVDGWRGQYVAAVADHFDFDIFTPIQDLTKKQYKVLMFGSKEKINFQMSMKGGDASWSHKGQWEGLLPQCQRLYQQTESDHRRRDLEKYMRISPCPSCEGQRLSEKALAVQVSGKKIIEVTQMSIANAVLFFDELKLSDRDLFIAKQVLKEIRERLHFLHQVGLGYLSLSRNAGSLSGGEAQRIRLATQIGANLMGVLYVLDEPSIGLHQRDNEKLIDTMLRLRDIGNTLVVVEHDEDTILRADYVVDVGPGAGIHGGHIVARGTPKEVMAVPESLTGQYLSGKCCIEVPEHRRVSSTYISLKGCRENNLKNIDVQIPLGVLTLITGVSGSGKSTLIYDILYRAMMQKLHQSSEQVGKFDGLDIANIDKVIVIDQSPIGKTPRSNPATYTKIFDEVRKLFAQTKEARLRGYKPGRFSFNVKGGRCEACQGDGVIRIEMNFLPDVYVPCEECKGKRYNRETLEVRYKGHSIADVLAMSVEAAFEVFEVIPLIRKKLKTLQRVGLEYISLGQGSNTLSGGEAQRIKLTRELAKRATGRTLYLLDEPTTGLHFHDVRKLIAVLGSLVEKGNSVVVIEHNLDVIKSADHVIDLGPEGGDGGGFIVAKGTPEEITACAESYTGHFLAKVL
ncbi:MAG: excinuclease ABC subunit UvrA [Mariprofundaceae bacterium]|nr:excinuclease ABC subunit UvrA [Mariprofundaceae bacterium]